MNMEKMLRSAFHFTLNKNLGTVISNGMKRPMVFMDIIVDAGNKNTTNF
jgi:hypothetical protein